MNLSEVAFHYQLNHYGLVMSYDITELGQHSIITWTKVDFVASFESDCPENNSP